MTPLRQQMKTAYPVKNAPNNLHASDTVSIDLKFYFEFNSLV